MTELLEKIGTSYEAWATDNDSCALSVNSFPNGKAYITNVNNHECDAETLKHNMLRQIAASVPAREPWDIEQCDANEHPFQTHHLIPHIFLSEHKVCIWLTTDPPRHKPTKITADTNYDTDDARNGYCLPDGYKTEQYQIKNYSREEVAFRIMRRTGKQHHYSKHKKEKYLADAEIQAAGFNLVNIGRKQIYRHPTTGKQFDETAGYKNTVDRLLKAVHDSAQSHANQCNQCPSSNGKVPPRQAVVDHVHGVSKILYALLVRNRIFVSKHAANYHLQKQSGLRPGDNPLP